MIRGDQDLETIDGGEHTDAVRAILVDAFKEIEPFAPVLVTREVDESGRTEYVSRPILPVAETIGYRREALEPGNRVGSIARVIDAVSEVTKYPQELIKATGGHRDLSIARHSAMYLARELVVPQPSYPKLGRVFHRDHSTVIHAVNNLKTLILSHDPDATARKERVAEIIERASKLLDQPSTESEKIIETENLVCLCLRGLVSSPVIDRKNKKWLSGASMGLDWEHAEETPEIYQRYGDAALRLARNVMTKARQQSPESEPQQK